MSREMTQQLRLSTVLEEDLSSVPYVHIWWLTAKFQGVQNLNPLASVETGAGAQTHSETHITHNQNNKDKCFRRGQILERCLSS